MAFFPIDPFPAEPPVLTTSVQGQDTTAAGNNLIAQQVINPPQTGTITRELLTWRTPHLGYVKMYINPQQMSIVDGKDITPTRTKGGFIIQYAGENMTQIDLEGTTGSAGIEGINILDSIYRSEQEAFEGIALALEERISVLQVSNITGLSSFLDPNLFQLASDSLRNFSRPHPTLASLAANIELFFQGVMYRGYFTRFSVRESAPESGHFYYSIQFMSYAKQGVRRNFMPWHRQPVNPANTHDSGVNPLSFPTIIEEPIRAETLPTPGTSGNQLGTDPRANLDSIFSRGPRGRSTGTASGLRGINITERDLRR